MRSLSSILLATDLFQTGDEVLLVAARLSELFGAKVHLLHVVKRHADLHVADFPISQHATDQLLIVKEQLARWNANPEPVPVKLGDPAEVIRHQAELLDVDLIVLGSGKPTPDRTVAIGPIAEAVMERARQPVLAVYPGTTVHALNHILCPVDHSETSRRGLRNAIRLAQAMDCELVVMSVVPDVSWLSAVIESRDFLHAAEQHDRRWREEFDHFLQHVEFGDIEWRSVIRSGKPAEQIVDAATTENAGLIVMGATGRTGLIRVLLGSVARSVLRRLPCSVLLVKDENLIDALSDEEARMVELLYVEGEALMEVQSYDAAVAKFDQVLAHNPFHVEALMRRADALDHIGATQRAARSRQRAAALQRVASGAS